MLGRLNFQYSAKVESVTVDFLIALKSWEKNLIQRAVGTW